MDPTVFLPSGLSPLAGAGFVALSFFTSALSAMAGLGGGMVLLAVLASVVPPVAALPVHGVVQFGSNAGRMWLMREHVERRVVAVFAAGAVVGITLGAWLFVALPLAVLQGILGAFILYSVWAPRLKPSNIPVPLYALVGLAGSVLTMFVGGTGPFVAAFLSPERWGRNAMVATHATLMAMKHALKTVAFVAIGFDFLPWAPLIAAMLITGLAGTWVGRHVLLRLPERMFRWLFRAVLTVLAGRLLWLALA